MPTSGELERAIAESTRSLAALRSAYRDATAEVRARTPGAQARRDQLFDHIVVLVASIDRARLRLRHTCPDCVRRAEHDLLRAVCDRHLPLFEDVEG